MSCLQQWLLLFVLIYSAAWLKNARRDKQPMDHSKLHDLSAGEAADGRGITTRVEK